MVVAILAILKAGGAYVPLDPAYPRERLALHAGRQRAARSLLTQDKLRERIAADLAAPVVVLDAASWPQCAWSRRPSTTRAPRSIGLSRIAPGLRDLHLRLDRPPKGVMVEHRSVRRTCCSASGMRSSARRDDRGAAVRTRSASTSRVWEIWRAAAVGAPRCVVARPTCSCDPAALWRSWCSAAASRVLDHAAVG